METLEDKLSDLTTRVDRMEGVVKGVKAEVKSFRPVVLMYARKNLLWVIALSLAIVSIIMQLAKQ